MKANKYLLILFSSVAIFALSSCLESDDLITADAKGGGLIEAPGVIPYKNADFDITFKVSKGTPVTSVKIKKYFTHNADTSVSDKVDLMTVQIGGANKSETVEKTISLTWADLKANIPTLPKGYIVPDNGIDAVVGDYFTLEFISVMEDGREVIGAKTLVSVANFFAGTYTAHIIYRHPSVGTYPDNIATEEDNVKDLMAVDGKTCSMSFAVWGPSEMMFIKVDPDNNYEVTLAKMENWDYDVALGDPFRADLKSSYDPSTGVLTLYYNYMGTGGYRVFWEVFTPKN